MRSLQAALLLAFLGAVAVFAVQNDQAVAVRFLRWGVTAPMALTVVAAYLVGMLSGWTVVAFLRRSIRKVTERPPD